MNTTNKQVRALRWLNGSITVAVVAALLLLVDTRDVFIGMVIKPLFLLGLIMAATWLDEWLASRVSRKTVRRTAYQIRTGDRRRRPRTDGSDRRAAPRRADGTTGQSAFGPARRTTDVVRVIVAAAVLLLPMTGFAQMHYVEGGHYTVSLQPSVQQWRLAPMAGTGFETVRAADCPHTVVPGNGLWLLGRDDDGRVELVAISTTELAPGDSERIALRACDDPVLQDRSVPGYGVPRPLLARLEQEFGAVLVHDEAGAVLAHQDGK